MHQSIAAAPSRGWGLLSCKKRGQMPPPPSKLQHFSLIAQSNNAVLSIFLMCEFFVSINVFLCCSTRVLTKTSRRDDMHQPRGHSRVFDTHAVSYQNITTQKVLLEKKQIGSSVKDRNKL